LTWKVHTWILLSLWSTTRSHPLGVHHLIHTYSLSHPLHLQLCNNSSNSISVTSNKPNKNKERLLQDLLLNLNSKLL